MRLVMLGQDDIGEGEFEGKFPGAVWVAYKYAYDGWGGDGEAVALMPDGRLGHCNLSHCSCYGPLDVDNHTMWHDRAEMLRILKPVTSDGVVISGDRTFYATVKRLLDES